MNVLKRFVFWNGQRRLEAQAREWVIRIDGGDLSTRDQAALQDWLRRSPRHQRIFAETARLWGVLDKLAEQPDTSVFNRRDTIVGAPAGWGFATKLAAAFCFVVLFGAMAYRMAPTYLDSRPAALMQYTTAVGEIKSVVLADGSSISLNTNTRLAVSYRRDIRIVHMPEGEAFFEVSHDKTKPFLVYAGSYAVRAVGTAFTVQMKGGEVDVVVSSGQVEVSALKQDVSSAADISVQTLRSAAILAPLAKGEQGVFNASADVPVRVERLDEGMLEQALAWREGMLVFDNDTLEDVVAELNRYSSARIVIADTDLGRQRFGGYFSVEDIGAILDTIEQNFGIQVDRIGEDTISLSPRQ
ncbi:MAG: FecR family protein [Pseudomonadales bacterium]|nr:FecR family protein [Pseudomonadales bacterium]